MTRLSSAHDRSELIGIVDGILRHHASLGLLRGARRAVGLGALAASRCLGALGAPFAHVAIVHVLEVVVAVAVSEPGALSRSARHVARSERGACDVLVSDKGGAHEAVHARQTVRRVVQELLDNVQRQLVVAHLLDLRTGGTQRVVAREEAAQLLGAGLAPYQIAVQQVACEERCVLGVIVVSTERRHGHAQHTVEH